MGEPRLNPEQSGVGSKIVYFENIGWIARQVIKQTDYCTKTITWHLMNK